MVDVVEYSISSSANSSGAFFAYVPRTSFLDKLLQRQSSRDKEGGRKLNELFLRYSNNWCQQLRELDDAACAADAPSLGGDGPVLPRAWGSSGPSSPLASLSPRHPAIGLMPQHQVQKYMYPGGGGVTVQPGFTAIGATDLVRVTPSVVSSKKFVMVFFGALSNLPDLLQRRADFKPRLKRRSRSSADFPEHAGGGRDNSDSDLEDGGEGGYDDDGQHAVRDTQTARLLLDMYRHYGPGEEVILLSELQGHYAFVLYDSARRHVFAARDPSGSELLYCKHDSDGWLFTNSLAELPDGGSDWEEVPPGHFVSGSKQPKMQQYALTPQQLQRRERKESLDAEALRSLVLQMQEETGLE